MFWLAGHYKGSSNYQEIDMACCSMEHFLCLLEGVCPALENRISKLEPRLQGQKIQVPHNHYWIIGSG